MDQETKRDLLATTIPRIPSGNFIPHAPEPPQTVFLLLDVLEAFYGGAAGGGKSDALLMAALQYVDVPGYSALILRRTYTDLSQPGALMDRASEWLTPTAARKHNGGKQWSFPSGARLTFGHVQHHREAEQQFSSAEFQFIGIDELTQGWEEKTYQFMFSRIRRPRLNCRVCRRPVEFDVEEGEWIHVRESWCERPIPIDMPAAPDGTTLANVPLRMRSASNPGGSGHAWVRDRMVDPETRNPRVVFVPARLEDNPHLDQESYEANLAEQGQTLSRRLLHGDWDVGEEGVMFKREWFDLVADVPAGVEWVRYWDLATGTQPGVDDATAGGLLGLHRPTGEWYIGDMAWIHERPLQVERAVVNTAHQDNDGRSVPVVMEQESGSSGVFTIDQFRAKLAGFEFHPDSPRGSKVERARAFSTAAEAGKVHCVGLWNEDRTRVIAPRWLKEFLDEVELFPIGPHDDQVDTISGGMKFLTQRKVRKPARARSVARRTLPG